MRFGGGTGSFTVTPNPAIEGEPVNVHGEPGGVVYWKADGETTWNELPLDDKGNGSFVAPPGVTGLTVSDRERPTSHTERVPVNSTL